MNFEKIKNFQKKQKMERFPENAKKLQNFTENSKKCKYFKKILNQ